jgi:hypothetical protein
VHPFDAVPFVVIAILGYYLLDWHVEGLLLIATFVWWVRRVWRRAGASEFDRRDGERGGPAGEENSGVPQSRYSSRR